MCNLFIVYMFYGDFNMIQFIYFFSIKASFTDPGNYDIICLLGTAFLWG